MVISLIVNNGKLTECFLKIGEQYEELAARIHLNDPVTIFKDRSKLHFIRVSG